MGETLEGVGGDGGNLTIADLTGDGRPELIYGAFQGAHSSMLWVLGWDGRAFGPHFVGYSNTPGIGVADLDGEGSAEILLPVSGYCGGYANSPRFQFVFRWRGGAYRPASADFPRQYDGFSAYLDGVLEDAGTVGGDLDPQLKACVEHMRATAYALQGRAGEARVAYDRHRAARASSNDDAGILSLPSYVGAEYLELEGRDLIARADSGRLGTWGPAERGVLDGLLGDALARRGR